MERIEFSFLIRWWLVIQKTRPYTHKHSYTHTHFRTCSRKIVAIKNVSNVKDLIISSWNFDVRILHVHSHFCPVRIFLINDHLRTYLKIVVPVTLLYLVPRTTSKLFVTERMKTNRLEIRYARTNLCVTLKSSSLNGRWWLIFFFQKDDRCQQPNSMAIRIFWNFFLNIFVSLGFSSCSFFGLFSTSFKHKYFHFKCY